MASPSFLNRKGISVLYEKKNDRVDYDPACRVI